MSQPDEDAWKDPVEKNATFPPITVDTSDLYDYVRWAGEDRGWRKLLAAVTGGAAVGTIEGMELAQGRVSPASVMEAGAAFQRAYETLSWLEIFVRDYSKAIAGPDRAWQGDAADAFIRKMETFSDWLGKQAERIAGGEGSDGANSLPNQLYHSGNVLAWAQQTMHSIDTQFAALSYAEDPARKGIDGNIAISGTWLEKPMAMRMQLVVGAVADQYTMTYDKVEAPPEHTPPITTPSPPSLTTPPKPSVTTPPLTTPPGITPPQLSVTAPPPMPTPRITPLATPALPGPPNVTPPAFSPGPAGNAPGFSPPPAFSGAPIGGGPGGGVPNISLPPFPEAGGLPGGGLPGFESQGPGGGAGGGAFIPPRLPPPPSGGNAAGGGQNRSTAGHIEPVALPAPGAGGGFGAGATTPGLPGSGLGLPAGGIPGLGGGGMPFAPGGAGGGAPGGSGAGVPEPPDANGLLGGEQDEWAPAGSDGVDPPQGGALPGGTGLGMPGGSPVGGMPFAPGGAGGGAPGGPGASAPDPPDANGLVIGGAEDWQSGGADGSGDPDAPYGVPAGGIGLDEPLPESTDGRQPDGGEPDGIRLADDPSPPVAPLAGSAYGVSVPGIDPDAPQPLTAPPADAPPADAPPADAPQPLTVAAGAPPLAVAAVVPGRPANDAGEGADARRSESAELLAEEVETWSAGAAGGESAAGDDRVPVVRPSDGDDDMAGWDDIAGSWWLSDEHEPHDQPNGDQQGGDQQGDRQGRLTDA
ncbi:hypothetical protein [Rhizomonospora bruguierae]|uniref:hypothetical protein n=1 Tax=Rhizomonospora bruguierae TaxID=1581705 RepID=UPI001BCE3BA5|nr:hypothetical protein [Micromonospora sp. NBRC 107566]